MNANVKKRLSDNMMWLVLIALIIVMSIGNSNFLYHRQLPDPADQ